MDPYTIGSIGMIIMLIMIFLEVPIGVAMGVAGVITFAYIRGSFEAAFTLFGTETASKISSTELAIIPMFLLMGSFATAGGLSSDLYRIAHAIIGHVRGGLAMATIGGCAAFGAVCGSSIATATTMTKIAIPEMIERNYSHKLATGSVAAGGTLGMLIPPSIILVLYAVLTEQFVKTLFIAALVPALLAMLLHFIAIYLVVRFDPEAGPAGERTDLAELKKALKNGWAAVLIILVVTGGIYGGVFSVNESAAVGAFMAFVAALVRRRLNWPMFWNVMRETASTTSMIYLMVIGASIFSYAVTVSGLPELVVDAIRDSGLSGIWVICLLMVMYLILGAIFDTISSMVITMPFVFPLILDFGYDPIWWGIMTVMVIEIGMISPPIGMNVFVVKAMLPKITLGTIYKGVMPFIGADLLRLAILIAFPSISLFLINWLQLPR